jgi:endogenous inhibitor of DNA gyrase (YacG/DUF329 family)
MSSSELTTPCPVCGALMVERAEYCSTKCEIKALKAQVSEKEKIVKVISRKGGRCIGRVEWSDCIQEWYLKDSYDAKRRAHALRLFGYTCEAHHCGRMPFKTKTGKIQLRHVTILTAWSETGAQLPDEPADCDYIL